MKKVIEYVGGPKFGGRNFAPYTDPRTGETVQWIANGKPVEGGPVLMRKKTLVTDEPDTPNFNPRAKELIAYLEGHPDFKHKRQFIIRDLEAAEKARLQTIRNKREVLDAYYNLSEEDLRKVLLIGKQDVYTMSYLDMKDKVQIIADQPKGAELLHEWMTRGDKEYRVILYQAIRANLIKYNNRRYTFEGSGEIIGLSEDQVVHFLKQNENEYAWLVKSLDEKATANIKEAAPGRGKEDPHRKAEESIKKAGRVSLEEAAKNLSVFDDDDKEEEFEPIPAFVGLTAEDLAKEDDDEMRSAAEKLKMSTKTANAK